MYRQDSPLHVDERSHAGRVAPQFRSPEKVLLDIRNRIDDAAKKQRDLSNSRENLLARRERTRASSKRVQAKRSEAGDAEAAFMDYIRDFMSSTTTPSFEMINLYNRVESARNDLGAMEADHQQLERSLSGADWMLKEEEDEFYQYGLTELFEGILEPVDQLSQDVARPVPLGPFQSMLPPPPPPPPPPHPVPAPPPALPPPLSPFIPSLVARSSDARSPWLQASHNQYQGVPLPPPRGVSSMDLHLSTPVAHSSLSQFAQTQGELQHLPVIKASDFEPAEANDIELDGLGDQFDSVSSPDPGLLEARDISASNDPSMLDFESLPSLSPTVLASDIHSKGLSYGWHHGTATSDTANDRFLTTHVPFNGRRLSDPTNYENKDLTIPQTLERSLSENTAYDMHRGRAAKNRVRAWLMSILVDSHMEKTLYYNILEATLEENGFHYPDHEPWGLPATQYWSRDSRSSFETDPFDKSTTALGTSQDPRQKNVGLQAASLNTSQSSIWFQQLPSEARTADDHSKSASHSETVMQEPAGEPSPLCPVRIPGSCRMPPKRKISPGLRTDSESSKPGVPKITIGGPQDNEDAILNQAAAKSLPSSPMHLSCDQVTWMPYRLEVHPARSRPASVSYHSMVRDFLSRKRRSRSMSSLTRSDKTTHKTKRTLSNDDA